MKYIRQLAIIVGVSFLGELLRALIPAPIPGSIYAFLLMLGGLLTGVVPLEKVSGTGRFLLEIMPLIFVPVNVGIMTVGRILGDKMLPVFFIAVVTTVLVMAVTGRVTQFAMKYDKKAAGEAAGADSEEGGGQER